MLQVVAPQGLSGPVVFTSQEGANNHLSFSFFFSY